MDNGREILRSCRKNENPSGRRFISSRSEFERINPTAVSMDESGTGLAGWVCRIQAACARGASNVLELARLVRAARSALSYGGWSKLWQTGEMPFSKRKGEMLVTIGGCLEGLSDAQTSARLPAAWNTLYYLARLGSGTLKQLIDQGRVHPGLRLQEARELLAEYLPGSRRPTSNSKLQIRLARFAEFIQTNLRTWSQQEREKATRELAALVGKIQAAGRETTSAGQTGHVRGSGVSGRKSAATDSPMP
jgi:hypothetical protein